MRKQDLEGVTRGYEAWNKGELGEVLELMDPEIEWAPGAESPEAGVFSGRDGVRELWSEAKKIFGGFRNEPEEIFDAGDRVVAFVRVEGVGAKSGVAVQARIAHLYTFRGGKVLRVESFEDRDAALRAAGISGAEPC